MYSRHHLLPTSREGANVAKNIELIPDKMHRAIHTLFANQMIAEQLITTIDISAKALRKDVREWLLETLSSRDVNDPYEWYRNDVIV